jgi:hypothetical protein
MFFPFGVVAFVFFSSCQEQTDGPQSTPLRYEEISYYRGDRLKNLLENTPYKRKVTYYLDNGLPHRWIEFDSLGVITTDYIYQYDQNFTQVGALYREERESAFSIEKVRYANDSTQVTEWLDSLGQVYYTMVDNLNREGKTYRAEFIGDKSHGFDSTFYTSEGLVKRVFFTNNKGKVFNDRSFQYDSILPQGEWIFREKVMQDTVVDLQHRELKYDHSFASDLRQVYYPGVLSLAQWGESSLSFSQDEKTIFFTRTKGWEKQIPYLSLNSNGVFSEPKRLEILGEIYNGALSPKGDKIIFSIKENGIETIWLSRRVSDQWQAPINLSATSKLNGGYFYWQNEQDLFFTLPENNSDLVQAKLIGDQLTIVDSLNVLNTPEGTEFSPYVHPQKKFIIFTRYSGEDVIKNGFYISYFRDEAWSEPEKIQGLSHAYGWSPYLDLTTAQLIYTDGEDFRTCPLERLKIEQ